MRHYLIGTIVFFVSFTAAGQINGVVTDSKTGKPLPGVDVFVNQTTAASQSDDAGLFTLDNVLAGFHDLVLYKKGYRLYRASMRIQSGHVYNLKLSLAPSRKKKTSLLNEEEHALLKNQLSHKNSDPSLVTVNEAELGVTTTDAGRLLASPLSIQNNATGYRLTYYGMDGPLSVISNAPVSYEPIAAADVKQKIQWEKVRKIYFRGSQRHWLIALVARQTKGQGYAVQKEGGNAMDTSSLLLASSLPGYSKVSSQEPVTIQFRPENGAEETSRFVTYGPVDVNGAGLPINPKALLIEGAMTAIGLADRLPVDYQPIAGDVESTYAQTLERFYEKVYVHTDKPYYYPGEPIWLKGYIHYQEPSWRDSLSRAVYVELISPQKKLVLSKTLKIDSGLFHNDFILPDTLQAGDYFLRAYTNLSRNFGDSALFIKTLPILGITDKVEQQGENEKTDCAQLVITPNEKKYKPRAKITLTLKATDKNGRPMAANMSMAVTDAIQVTPIEEPLTISNGYPLATKKVTRTIELKYPVEYGVSYAGKFTDSNGKPEKTSLTIFQLKPRNMMMAVSDEQGIFSITGLSFYDSGTFSFKPDKAKEFTYGKVTMLPREIASLDFRVNHPNLVVQTTRSPQRTNLDQGAPKEGKLLNTVEVRASRIPEEFQSDYRLKRPYGAADAILKAKDLNTSYGNLIYALVGKVAGLVVQPDAGYIGFSRAATQSIAFGSGPMVTINDVPMGGNAFDIISNINPSSVESIEFTKRLNVIYGSQGANGVISIYTKHGVSEDALKVAPNFQTLQLMGYSRARSFKFPNYDDKASDPYRGDKRSTVYWNPNISTRAGKGEAAISFFAADLPGRYRIVVEGISQSGDPIRCVMFIDIDKD